MFEHNRPRELDRFVLARDRQGILYDDRDAPLQMTNRQYQRKKK
jgi:hypothetical protein